MPSQLSEKTVDALLDKLSSDDEFRDQFQKNPRQALASLGDAAAADSSVTEGAWACMSVTSLASKDAIRGSRDQLRAQLLSARAGMNPITLETQRR